MSTKFKNELKRRLAAFGSGGNQKMGLRFIPASCLSDMTDAARAGDKAAQCSYLALERWFQTANEMVAETHQQPRCCHCGVEFHGSDVSGWAVLLPADLDPASAAMHGDETVGLVTAYCQICFGIDRGKLARKFIEMVKDHLGHTLVTLQ